jgi:hypothetical protein
MEENHVEWRKGNNTLAQSTRRRKAITRAVEKRLFCSSSSSDLECCAILEAKRNELGFSLDKFQKWLLKEHKEDLKD